jgi:hypothetical protein
VSSGHWIALWAGFLAVLTALMLLFDPGVIAPLLLGGAALGTLVLALAARAGSPRDRAPDSSLPAVGVAIGIALLVGGSEVGPWLLAIGGGVLVLSLGTLVRERRAG